MSKPVFDAVAGGNLTTAGTSLSWNHTCTANYLLVALTIQNAHSNLSVTYNGVAMSQLGSVGGTRITYWFGLANPTQGTNSVQCSWTTSRTAMGSSISYAETNLSDPVGTAVGNNSTTDASTSVDVPSTNDDVVVDVLHGFRSSNTTSPTFTVGANQTARRNVGTNDGTNSFRQAISEEDGNGGNVTMSWTMANQSDFRHLALAVHGVPEGRNFQPAAVIGL